MIAVVGSLSCDSIRLRSSPAVNGQVVEVGGGGAAGAEAVNLEVCEQNGTPAQLEGRVSGVSCKVLLHAVEYD